MFGGFGGKLAASAWRWFLERGRVFVRLARWVETAGVTLAMHDAVWRPGCLGSLMQVFDLNYGRYKN
jgi:hypothetical protein